MFYMGILAITGVLEHLIFILELFLSIYMPWGEYKVHIETFWHIQMADYISICKFFLRCNVFNTLSNTYLGDTGFMLKCSWFLSVLTVNASSVVSIANNEQSFLWQ